jgi:hypothetical protein
MSAPNAKQRKLPSCVSRRNLVSILSISGAVISLGCIVEGFYILAAITAGANLIATRSAVGNPTKGSLVADR